MHINLEFFFFLKLAIYLLYKLLQGITLSYKILHLPQINMASGTYLQNLNNYELKPHSTFYFCKIRTFEHSI